MPNTRERILECAAHAFAAEGFRYSTVSRIASAAQVNEVTIYRYFPKKSDLYWDAIDRRLRRTDYNDRLTEAIEGAVNLADLVQRLALEISHILNANPMLARLIHFTVLELERERISMVKFHFQPMFAKIVDRIRAWSQSGMIRDVDSTNASWAVVGVLLAQISLRELLGEMGAARPPKEVAIELADFCLDGLACHSSRTQS
jgi:AcrR family transcriptional regulator